jgi:alkaline phosphatase D
VYFLDEDLDPGRRDRLSAFRKRYAELFADSDFSFLVHEVPTFAIWDDHDFGPNNSDGTYSEKHIAWEAFRENFGALEEKAAESLGVEVTSIIPPGMARSFVYRGVRFVFTDNRWNRKNAAIHGAKEIADTQFFGDEQLQWIEGLLEKDDVALTVLAAGGQLLAQKGIGEELIDYPQEFGRILDAVRSAPAPVVILSGDRHYSEILEMRFSEKRALEFTSSPLTASPNHPYRAKSDPSRIAIVLEKLNFGVLTIEGGEQFADLLLTVTYFDPEGAVLLKQEFQPMMSSEEPVRPSEQIGRVPTE